ncbi:MAG TPA: FAD-binding oxidoreductase [Myxococcota bacterium]|nr:FAD-binding oxidoreductase [Myxococcota bacterium]
MSFTCDGVAIAETLAPKSAPDLAAALGATAARGGAVLVRGGGSRLGIGNALRRADAVLDVRGLDRLLELDADEGVLHAEAGVPLMALRGPAAEAGWTVPLDPPGERTTVGGALASGVPGACFAQPRDAVLGLSVALADGSLVKMGGRVVKNVTGYDLAKLFVGSFGALGVVTSAWIRLRPRPEAHAVLAAPLPADPRAVLDASRRPAVRAAVAVDAALAPRVLPDAAGAILLLEVCGDAPAVDADRAALADRIGAAPCEPMALARVRELLASDGPEGDALLALRVAVVPSAVPAACAALAAAGLAVVAQPARGFVHARRTLPEGGADAAFVAALAAARSAAASGSGTFRVEAAPLAQRRGIDVFGDPAPHHRLLRRLKAEYDPGGVLNPGRFAGGL